MSQIYEELLSKASEINTQIKKLRDAGEYMCSCHLQEGYIKALESLESLSLLSDAERTEIEKELSKL